MLLIFLIEAERITPLIGKWGTLFAFAWGVTATLAAVYFAWRHGEAESLRRTNTALQTEREVLARQCSDKEKELAALAAEVVRLQAKTDLEQVLNLIHESNQVTNGIVRTMDAAVNAGNERYRQMAETLTACGVSLQELSAEIKEDRRQTTRAFAKVNGILDKILKREGIEVVEDEK